MSPYKSQSPLEKYGNEIDHLRIALDDAFGVNLRANPSVPEDRVIFPLGVATRDLFEEVIWLVQEGFGNGALRTPDALRMRGVLFVYQQTSRDLE